MTSDLASMTLLHARLTIAVDNIKNLRSEVDKIEVDSQMSEVQKLFAIKKIKEELNKVGTEIDNIKKEINLLNAHRVN
jgi:hypothetical protein